MVIEDNVELLEVLRQVTVSPSIQIHFATSALEALKIIRKENIGAILADVEMENKDLLDAHLHKLYSKIPIFRMSGSHRSYTNLMLVKPFSIAEYRSTIIQLQGLGQESQKVA